MQAMVLTRVGLGHVEPIEIETPVPGPDEVLVKVLACGVCRTDLHVVDGELPEPTIPVVPGPRDRNHPPSDSALSTWGETRTSGNSSPPAAA